MSVLSENICVLIVLVRRNGRKESQVDLSMRTDSKETMINKPPSHLFTAAALPLHGSEECSQTLIIGLSD
jgi:hypothetical protein